MTCDFCDGEAVTRLESGGQLVCETCATGVLDGFYAAVPMPFRMVRLEAAIVAARELPLARAAFTVWADQPMAFRG